MKDELNETNELNDLAAMAARLLEGTERVRDLTDRELSQAFTDLVWAGLSVGSEAECLTTELIRRFDRTAWIQRDEDGEILPATPAPAGPSVAGVSVPRAVLAAQQRFNERLLGVLGEATPVLAPELITLQHTLADLLQPSGPLPAAKQTS